MCARNVPLAWLEGYLHATRASLFGWSCSKLLPVLCRVSRCALVTRSDQVEVWKPSNYLGVHRLLPSCGCHWRVGEVGGGCLQGWQLASLLCPSTAATFPSRALKPATLSSLSLDSSQHVSARCSYDSHFAGKKMKSP